VCEDVECFWCETTHPADYLCPEAGEVLVKLKDRGGSFDAPTIELTDALDENVEGVLCSALGVKAFYTETLRVFRPGLAIQPIGLDGKHGTPLLLIDDERAIRRVGTLVDEMSRLAVRRARKAHEEHFGIKT
jgi:hypothetical protein